MPLGRTCWKQMLCLVTWLPIGSRHKKCSVGGLSPGNDFSFHFILRKRLFLVCGVSEWIWNSSYSFLHVGFHGLDFGYPDLLTQLGSQAYQALPCPPLMRGEGASFTGSGSPVLFCLVSSHTLLCRPPLCHQTWIDLEFSVSHFLDHCPHHRVFLYLAQIWLGSLELTPSAAYTVKLPNIYSALLVGIPARFAWHWTQIFSSTN